MTTISRASRCGIVLLVVAGCAQPGTEPIEPAPPPSTAAATTAAVSQPTVARPAGRWVAILRRLDLRRERAFTRGAPSLLGRVYVPGSAVRRADGRQLRAYLRRGLRLESARLRLDTVAVVRTSSREATLRVVDTLRPVRVRAGDGPWRALPRDLPTERTITLRRLDAGWRIAGIRRVAG